jgi:hypothetical protein
MKKLLGREERQNERQSGRTAMFEVSLLGLEIDLGDSRARKIAALLLQSRKTQLPQKMPCYSSVVKQNY